MRNQRHRSSFSIPWLTAALLVCGALLMAALSVVVNASLAVAYLTAVQAQLDRPSILMSLLETA